ncbi:c3orf15 protein [Cystoisospora suis]|uniref:Cilia- and flagella-associated protein 91 n=1 Tax=Cystoisospora suis TaxID=483139 RepID=A0A2C6L234_9APIC|nr:c3orf15 protein [Cystoisospora suis]
MAKPFIQCTRERPLDVVYDPNVVFSGATDLSQHISRTLAARLTRVPVQQDWFLNDLRQKCLYRVDPPSQSRFSPQTSHERLRNERSKEDDRCKVWGELRFKFAHYGTPEEEATASVWKTYEEADAAERSLAAQSPALRALDEAQCELLSQDVRRKAQTYAAGKANSGTQSLYSEREAQTIPYSPPTEISDGQRPEELAIAYFCWERGLPATQLEISIIQRMRQQRKIENLLPPTTDEYSFQARAALMEEQEFREWSDRENHIKNLHERKLELFRSAICERRQRTDKREEDALARMDRRLSDESATQTVKADADRIKNLRRMRRQLVAVESFINPRRWEAINNSTKRASQLFAPRSIKGHIPDDVYASLAIESPELKALEDAIVRLRQEAAREQANADRGDKQGLEAAAVVLDSINGSHCRVETVQSVSLKKYHMRNIRERPETPRIEEVLPEDEESQVAAILLQRVLRGQACQQKIFSGKQMRLDLINFLRAAEQLSDIPAEEQQRHVGTENAAEAAEALMGSLQGQAISETLDELAKELRKLEEERRIAVMVNLANRDRRLREAQESGTRQAEELLRAREDETFKRVMTLHQQTVDSYVESILASSVEQAAKQQAVIEAKLRAEQLSRVVDDLEDKYQNPNTIVRELVTGFLLPHVKKHQLQKQLSLEEEKYNIAARYAVGESFQPLRTSFGPLFQ